MVQLKKGLPIVEGQLDGSQIPEIEFVNLLGLAFRERVAVSELQPRYLKSASSYLASNVIISHASQKGFDDLLCDEIRCAVDVVKGVSS